MQLLQAGDDPMTAAAELSSPIERQSHRDPFLLQGKTLFFLFAREVP